MLTTNDIMCALALAVELRRDDAHGREVSEAFEAYANKFGSRLAELDAINLANAFNGYLAAQSEAAE